MKVVRHDPEAIHLEIEYGETYIEIYDPCIVSKKEWLDFVDNVRRDEKAFIEYDMFGSSFIMETTDDGFEIYVGTSSANIYITLDSTYKDVLINQIEEFTKNMEARIDWGATYDESSSDEYSSDEYF